ncbi:uncharacterized protein LOC114941060 [Nylanderia fulva]|uniref:uncharacterized protein LOC114941060 n=1 Tax=Nylanderia fulva TaxID=613905 RepID=UPI0010FB24B1|nr:uncharacterized protein LOC114941060 [Nylanderia fulva]
MRDPDRFTVVALKELLAARGLSTAGTKAELIARLMEDDPSGAWMDGQDECGDGGEDSQQREVAGAASAQSASSRQQREAAGAASAQPASSRQQREVELHKRERELAERELAERELAERELAVARLELEVMRKKMQAEQTIGGERRQSTRVAAAIEREQVRAMATGSSGGSDDIPAPLVQTRTNITAIADLLSVFDGKSSHYETWEKQIKQLRSTYRLEDVAKILIGMRLKGRAHEWLHSRAEHITMTFDHLLDELRAMFFRRQSKVTTRKKFEERVWRKGETFQEYFHEKIILGNHVSIEEDEMLEYLIEGIPDERLKDQARIQRFAAADGLLEAFERVTLRDRGISNASRSTRTEKRVSDQGRSERRETANGSENRRFAGKIAYCFNCGERDHLGINCPTKEQGAKCFQCGKRRHIASSLIHADDYIKLGSPCLRCSRLLFDGVGSNNNTTLGKFQAKLRVEGHSYSVCIHVVSDTMLRHKLLLGTDFLNLTDVNIRGGDMTIRPLAQITRKESGAVSDVAGCESTRDVVRRASVESEVASDVAGCENMPEILKIDVIRDETCKASHVNVSHVEDSQRRKAIEKLINNYKSDRTGEAEVTMKLVLRDEEPVHQSAKRLSAFERTVVNAQIDRYPLPLIEDQLDMLKGARVFSTLDLTNGFFHVRVNESSRKYTAFIVPNGHYEFLRVPFGLCNSPAVFQRYVNTVFRDLIRERIVLAYMDDLIIPSSDVESGIRNLERVLVTASETGLMINCSKCCFLETTVEFLGHVICNGCVRLSDRKTEAVRRFPCPASAKQVQSFLGLSGYFRKFIEC